MIRKLATIAVLLLLFGGIRTARAQDDEESRAAPSSTQEDEIVRRNRERWNRMTEDERRKAIERLKRFQALSEEEQAEILRKARRGIGELPSDIREDLFRERHRLSKTWLHLRRLSKEVKANLPEDLRETIAGLPGYEGRAIDWYLFAGLFESQFRTALDEAPDEVRERIERMSPFERKKAVRELFADFRKRVLRHMDPATRERIAALPPDAQVRARNEYVESAIDRKRVALVTRTLEPELRELVALPAPERWWEIVERVKAFEAERRGPQGLRDYLRPTAEEQAQLRGMSQEDRRRFFRRRTRHWLRLHEIGADEVDRLLEMPMRLMFRELQRTHPELFEDPAWSRPGGFKGRGPGRTPGGGDDGPHHPGDRDLRSMFGPYRGR